jgi:hypothetical protein
MGAQAAQAADGKSELAVGISRPGGRGQTGDPRGAGGSDCGCFDKMAAALQRRIHDGKACNGERPGATILWRVPTIASQTGLCNCPNNKRFAPRMKTAIPSACSLPAPCERPGRAPRGPKVSRTSGSVSSLLRLPPHGGLTAQVRAKEREAALVAAYTSQPGITSMELIPGHNQSSRVCRRRWRLPKNDRVEDFDFEELPCAYQIACHFNVGCGRCGVSARMLMGDASRLRSGRDIFLFA